ncbi:MAG: hypothetical protein QM496_20005 [Verrucomicrobiota bacterium]
MSETSAPSLPGIGFYLKRYLSALKNALKPRYLMKAIWRTISRRLFIALFFAPFIYGLAAIWHIYLQAKAGGWNGPSGLYIQPEEYALAGARWFAGAMFLFGIYGFARGTGFQLFKTTWGALKVAPSGFRYSLDSVKKYFKNPAFYERIMITCGAAAMAGDTVLKIAGWQFRKFILLAVVVTILAGLKAAHEQWCRPRATRPPIEKQFWVSLLSISLGFLLTYLYYSFWGMVVLGVGISLWYRRTHSSKDDNNNSKGAGGSGSSRQNSISSLLMLCFISFLFFTPALLFADDGGWNEYSPKNGGKKTLLGYLQTPEGQKIIGLGLIAGGFATAGAVTGVLLGGTLGDALRQSLDDQMPASNSAAPPPLSYPTDLESEFPLDEPGWEVTGSDGIVRNFKTLDEAEDFCDQLRDREYVRQAEGDFQNTVEQIGFVESVRNGLRKSGRDTSSQDRELERLRRDRNRFADQVNELGGSTNYKARDRRDWDFSENDEFIRKQKEKRDLLRDIHKMAKATRNLAEQGNINHGEGQTDNILDHLDKMSKDLVSKESVPPNREELDRLKGILRNEMDASRMRDEARNTNWVKEGAQSTSREIFTGLNANGETSYKSMALRGLMGVASGGQSEYVMEVGDKMYVVHDEVMKGKTGIEAFHTAATRVVFDEVTGRVVESGIKAGSKISGAGYNNFVKGSSIDDAFTAKLSNTKKFLNQDIGNKLVGAGKDITPGYKPKALVIDESAVARRTDAFNQGRKAGANKIAELDEALTSYKQNPSSPDAVIKRQQAVDKVQQDKHAMNILNERGDDALSHKIREGFNRDLKTSYEQAHLSTRERIAQEYGVPVEKVKVVKPTNAPSSTGDIESTDLSSFAKKPNPAMKTHTDDFTQAKPSGKIEGINGDKVSFDQDITYRVEQDHVINPRTGKIEKGFADVPKADTKRIYEEEFYKARNDGKLPYQTDPSGKIELDSSGRPVINTEKVHQYNKDMDQACTDRLDKEAYGTGDRDLQTAVKDDYKGRDSSDIEAVAKTSEYKQREWRNEASDLNEKAAKFRQDAQELQSTGNPTKADQAVTQADSFEAKAEGLTEEGYRQTTKQYGNQLEAKVDSVNQQEFYKHHNNGDLPMRNPPLSGEMEVDMNRVRANQEEFYKNQKGELPTIKNSDGTVRMTEQGHPQIDTKEVTRFTTEQGKISGMRTAEISPRLTEAVDIMKNTGKTGFSPAEVEMKLAKIGYTPDKVAQQLSSNLEGLQKFKSANQGFPPSLSTSVKSSEFDFEKASQNFLQGVSKPTGKSILRDNRI